jgi:S1-C subfamily serine protease
MTASTFPDALLPAYSKAFADLVETAGRSVVAVNWRDRALASGILWRDGLVITASDAVEPEADLAVTLPDGAAVEAAFAGRDPTTDIALLRIAAGSALPAAAGEAALLRPGDLVLAVGRRASEAGTGMLAAGGIVAISGEPWRSRRGGRIDRLLELDIALNPAAEGGAVVDAAGRLVGMAVRGARRRVLAIPAETITRVGEELLAKGRIARGYLGLGMRRVALPERLAQTLDPAQRFAVIAISVDPGGPAARAGIVLGDVLARWNGAPIENVGDIVGQLDAAAIGAKAELTIFRGGGLLKVEVEIGERAS